jgi:hypothetical protein
MAAFDRDGSVCPWLRILNRVLRTLVRIPHLLLVAVAAGLGAPPPPRPFRHEDPVVQVAEDES